MIRGITAGSFDLCHAGHILMFKECKEHCDHLTVALQTDPTVDRKDKNKPTQSIAERLIQLMGCRYVDEVKLYTTEAQLIDLLKEEKPDVRIIGSDWEGKEFTGKDLPIKVIFNTRNHTFSSSELRTRIYEAENKRLNS